MFVIPMLSWGQDAASTDAKANEPAVKSFSFLVDVLGSKGLLITIGLMCFILTYRYSQRLFAWIESQMFGTLDVIQKKFDIMHIEIEPQRITWFLIGVSFGIGILTFGIFALFGKFFLGQSGPQYAR